MKLSKVLLLTAGTLVSLGASSPLVIRTLSARKGDNSYKSAQKQNAGKSVYEIWWPGFAHKKDPKKTKTASQQTNSRVRGNAQGIIDKLDYVKSLNVDYIWITPFFQSPQLDNGYDVTDYYNVDPLFGTNEDFRKILKQAHAKGLKVLIDLVMNHTSVEHPWFLWATGRSVSSSSFWEGKEQEFENFKKYNSKPDGLEFPDFKKPPKPKVQEYYQKYYWIFKDTGNRKNDKEKTPLVKNPYYRESWDPFKINGKSEKKVKLPWFHQSGLNDNVGNKFSVFSSIKRRPNYSWKDISYDQYSEFGQNQDSNTTPYSVFYIGEERYFYLHTFSDFQPDLNWNNPQVRKEMKNIANFYINGEGWLDRLDREKVDGFRFDAVTLIGKNPASNLLVPGSDFETYLSEFRNATYGPKNLFTIGELSQAKADDKVAKAINKKVASENFTTAYLPLDTLWNYRFDSFGKDWGFPGTIPSSKLDFATYFQEFLDDSYQQSQKIMGNNSALIAENHDQPRSVSRFGASKFGNDPFYKTLPQNFRGNRKDSYKHYFHAPRDPFHLIDDMHSPYRYVFPRAKSLAAFKFLQPGIPIIYQGQEISMDNYPFYYEDADQTFLNEEFEKSVDLQVRGWVERANYLDGLVRKVFKSRKIFLEESERLEKKTFLDTLAETGRDSARTPFQWSAEENAGWGNDFIFKKLNDDSSNLLNKNKERERKFVEKPTNKDKFLTIFEDQRKIKNEDSFFTTSSVYGKTPEEVLKKPNKYKVERRYKPRQIIADTQFAPLLLNPHYEQINEEKQENDPNSPLSYYQKVLNLRHCKNDLQDILLKGRISPWQEGKDFSVLSYEKNHPLDVNPTVAAYQVKGGKGKNLVVIADLGNKQQQELRVPFFKKENLDEKLSLNYMTDGEKITLNNSGIVVFTIYYETFSKLFFSFFALTSCFLFFTHLSLRKKRKDR